MCVNKEIQIIEGDQKKRFSPIGRVHIKKMKKKIIKSESTAQFKVWSSSEPNKSLCRKCMKTFTIPSRRLNSTTWHSSYQLLVQLIYSQPASFMNTHINSNTCPA